MKFLRKKKGKEHKKQNETQFENKKRVVQENH